MRTHLLSNGTGALLLGALVVLSVLTASPVASAGTTDGYTQSGTDNAANGEGNETVTNGGTATGTESAADDGNDAGGTDDASEDAASTDTDEKTATATATADGEAGDTSSETEKGGDETATGDAAGGTDGSSDDEGTDGTDGANDVDDGATPLDDAVAVDSIAAIENDAIGADGAADVYAFELEEGTQVEIAQGSGGGALPVTLLDENGDVLGRIADRDVFEAGQGVIVANASYSGTYYLRVDGEAGAAYSILQSVTEPDANEPNDAIDTATDLDLGERAEGTIVRGDADAYAVSLDANESILYRANGTAAARLSVYGPATRALPDDPGHGDGTLFSRTIPAPGDPDDTLVGLSPTADAGTYVFVVRPAANATGFLNGEYELTVVDTSSNGSGATERPNGTTGTADDRSDDADGSTDRTTATDSAEGTGATETTTTDTSATDVSMTDASTTGESRTATSSPTTGGEPTRTTGTLATETSSAGTGDSASETPGEDIDTTGDGDRNRAEETAVNGPGFGVAAALIALFGAALLATHRD